MISTQIIMRSEKLGLCLIFLLKNKELIIGMYVRESKNAPNKAKATVCAIGLNIFPSMPSSVKIGKYTIRMMICPNTALFIILPAALSTVLSIFDCDKASILLNCLLCASWCITASTMMTAPSTINPKSSAPKLIRLPLTPNVFIRIMANNIASGITEATNNPARKLPRNSTRTKMTISAPSNKFFSTVPMA